MHFILFYELQPDYLERRGEFRDAHLTKAWTAHDRGEFVLGGVLKDPTDTALLVFQGESKEAVEEFARTDPYVINGLVKSWSVREWATVAGALASNPVHPTNA